MHINANITTLIRSHYTKISPTGYITGGAFAAAIALLHTGCLQAPVQMGRVVMTETYHQRYELCGHREAARVVVSILGERNRCVSESDWNTYVLMAEQHQLELIGQIVITLSVYPADLRKFFVEGKGRHFVYSRNTHELLASSTFVVVDDGPHWISDLSKGELVVRLAQDTEREYRRDLSRYNHRQDVFARVHVLEIAPHVFAIDHDAEHELGVSLSQTPETYGGRIAVQTVGYLQFDGPRDARKLVDLSIRESAFSSLFARNDYWPLIAELSLPSTGGGPVVQWKPKQSCEEAGHGGMLAGEYDFPDCNNRIESIDSR